MICVSAVEFGSDVLGSMPKAKNSVSVTAEQWQDAMEWSKEEVPFVLRDDGTIEALFSDKEVTIEGNYTEHISVYAQLCNEWEYSSPEDRATIVIEWCMQ
jgi:hypothetical protein